MTPFVPRSSPIWKSPVVAASFFVVVVAVVIVSIATQSEAALRDHLRHIHYWVLELLFIGVGILTSFHLRTLTREAGGTRAHHVAMTAACILAGVLCVAVAPKSNRIFYDEQIYQSVGQNMADLKLAQVCHEGTVEYGRLQCWRWDYNKQPYGYPHLLSLGFRLAGTNDLVPYVVNVGSLLALVWVVYFTAALLSSPTGGVLAGLIAALTPMLLAWSHTAAVEPTASLTCAIAFLAAITFVRRRSTASLAWAVFATAYACQFRPESILIVPVVAATVLVGGWRELIQPRIWWASSAFVVLSSTVAAHMVAVRGERWGTESERVSLDYVWQNLPVNGWFYVWDERFPMLYSWLALAGSWRLGLRAVPVVTYFAAFVCVYLLFYAGSYNYGADVRYSLLTYTPLAVLAGIGADWITRSIPARTNLRTALAAMVGLIGFQFLSYLPVVRSVGEDAWAARADVTFAREFAVGLPSSSIVLTHNPNMFQVWGTSAAQLSLATTHASYVNSRLFERYAGGVYVHWSYWCVVPDPAQHVFCERALTTFPHTTVAERVERGFRYALIRLAPTTKLPPLGSPGEGAPGSQAPPAVLRWQRGG